MTKSEGDDGTHESPDPQVDRQILAQIDLLLVAPRLARNSTMSCNKLNAAPTRR
jgi:hypothetical protein